MKNKNHFPLLSKCVNDDGIGMPYFLWSEFVIYSSIKMLFGRFDQEAELLQWVILSV